MNRQVIRSYGEVTGHPFSTGGSRPTNGEPFLV